MSQALWTAQITAIGPDATDMVEAGVIILFGEPVPDALAEVSIVHNGTANPAIELCPGARFIMGEQTFTVDDVGSRAMENLDELGHIVMYINQPDQELLPGAVKASGDPAAMPRVGAQISFVED